MSDRYHYVKGVRLAALSRSERKEETKRAILRAATRLFASRGISATSIDRIAASIGLTSGAVYANFRSKRELIDAVADAASLAIDPTDFLYRTDLGLQEKLAMLAERYFALREQLTRDRLLFSLELWLFEFRDRKVSKRMVEAQRAARREVGERLERSGNRLPMSGPELLTVLNALGLGLAVELGRDPEAISDAAIRTVFALLSGEPVAAAEGGPPMSRAAGTGSAPGPR